MSAMIIIASVLGIAFSIYLCYSIINPEKF